MFNAPFWSALESLYSVHILPKFGAICVMSSTLLHFSCCKVKKNNSIIKILFHNFHIICYYSKMGRRCRIRTDILPVIRKVSLSYRMRYHLRQPTLFMNKCRTLLLHNQTATFSWVLTLTIIRSNAVHLITWCRLAGFPYVVRPFARSRRSLRSPVTSFPRILFWINMSKNTFVFKTLPNARLWMPGPPTL